MSAPARPENSISRFLINSASSGAGTLINIGVLIWVNQYLLWRIEADEYALVPIVTALMVVVELFGTAFSGGTARFMVEADARGDDAEVTRIVSSSFPILCAVTLLLAICGAAVVWKIDAVIVVDPDFLADARIMFALLFAQTCARILMIPFTAGIVVRMRFVDLNLIQVGVQLLRVAILLVLLFEVSTRALWVVASAAIAGMIGTAIEVAYSRWVLPAGRLRLSMISRSRARTLTTFTVWNALLGFSMLVQRSVPVILLNQTNSAVDVAAYHLGNLPNRQLRRLFSALDQPVRPALTALFAVKGAAALQELYYRGGRYYMWITLFVLPPVLVFAKTLFELYVGDTYLAAGTVLLSVLGIYPVVWASGMFFQVAYAIGRIITYNICNLALSGVSVVALYVLVVHYDLGAIGAAWALAGSYLFVSLFLIWPLGLRLVEGSWTTFLVQTVLRGVMPFAAAVAGCEAFGQVVNVDTWMHLGQACMISAAIYSLVLVGFCLTPVDKELLWRGIERASIRKVGASGA